MNPAMHQLSGALTTWLDHAVNVLQDRPLYKNTFHRQERHPSGEYFEIKFYDVLDYRTTVSANSRDLIALAQTSNVLHVVEQDPELASCFLDEPNTSARPPLEAVFWRLLSPLLSEYLEREGQVISGGASWNLVLELVEQRVTQLGRCEIRWRVLFWNLDYIGEPISLDHHKCHLRASNRQEYDEIARWEQLPGVEHTHQMTGRYDLGGVVEIVRRVEDLPDLEPPTISSVGGQIARDVVLALRLLRPEWVGQESIIVESLNPFLAISGGRGWGDRELWSYMPPWPIYRLEQPEIDKFLEILPLIPGAYDAVELKVPIMRFNDSYRRRDRYDRHLDYWMVLESLLVASSKEDLTQILRATLPLYLYDTQHDRSIIRRLVTDSYDLRSRLIHGSSDVFPWEGSKTYHDGKENPNAETRDRLIDLTSDWVRRALIKRIQELALAPEIQ